MSRIRPPVNLQALIEATPPLAVVSPVDGIVVLRSHRENGLSRYESLERFVLRETSRLSELPRNLEPFGAVLISDPPPCPGAAATRRRPT